jgi:hypothetical protein
MGKEWLWWLGEFGLAATVAIVAGFVTRDVSISILYGLFVGTVFFVLRAHTRIASQQERQINEIEDKVLDLPVTPSHLEGVHPSFTRILQSERNELLRLAKEVTNGELTLRTRPLRDYVNSFYGLIAHGDKVVATNYGVGWGTPSQDVVRQINYELAESGVDFTRIFIESTTATPEDKKRLKQEMEREKVYLHVRFVKEAKLPLDMRKNMRLVYDKCVGYAIWSKPVGSGIRQNIEEITFYTRRDELEKAKEMAENLIKLSEEYK